jgi:hypothetical protein
MQVRVAVARSVALPERGEDGVGIEYRRLRFGTEQTVREHEREVDLAEVFRA